MHTSYLAFTLFLFLQNLLVPSQYSTSRKDVVTLLGKRSYLGVHWWRRDDAIVDGDNDTEVRVYQDYAVSDNFTPRCLNKTSCLELWQSLDSLRIYLLSI